MNEDKLNGEKGCEGIVAWDTGQRDDLGVWARVVAMRLRCADRRAVTNQQLWQRQFMGCCWCDGCGGKRWCHICDVLQA